MGTTNYHRMNMVEMAINNDIERVTKIKKHIGNSVFSLEQIRGYVNINSNLSVWVGRRTLLGNAKKISAVAYFDKTGYNKFRTLSGRWSEERGLLPGAKDVIEDTVIRFVKSYFTGTTVQSTPWIKEVNGEFEVDWNAIGKSVQLVIPTRRKNVKGGMFGWDEALMNPRGLSVNYGVPYLVIKPNIANSRNPADTHPVLIPMQPVKFSKRSKQYKVIKELYQHVATIESTGLLLGTEEFADIIRNYAHSEFEVDTVAGNDHARVLKLRAAHESINKYFGDLPTDVSIAVEDAVQNIIPLIFSPELKTLYFSTEEEALNYVQEHGVPHSTHTTDMVINGKLVVGVAKVKDKRDLWTVQYSTDPTNRDDTSTLKVFSVREGAGPAQVALNTLAQANNTVGDSFTQLRKEKRRSVDGSIVRTFKTHSILGNFEEDSAAGKTANTEYVDYKSFNESDEALRLLGGKTFSKYSQLLDALEEAYISNGEATEKREARAMAYELVSRYQAAHITSELLDAIVGDASFDANDNHNIGGQSLRQPLQLHTSEKSGIHDLGEKLTDNNRKYLNTLIRTNFERVANTAVYFKTDKVETTVTAKPMHTTVGELLNSMPSFDPMVDEVTKLLKSLPIKDVRVSYAPGGLMRPDGTIDSNSFVTGYGPDGVIYITITRSPEQISKDRELYTIFLHEVLHSLTLPALQKGQVDARKKIDSKEAQFYKRLVAVKRRFDKAITSKINPETGARYKTSDVYAETSSKLDVFEFVANLSNPKFITLAKSIALVPKATKSKSVFRELLESIANFLRSKYNHQSLYKTQKRLSLHRVVF